jgi:hypothetical protein
MDHTFQIEVALPTDQGFLGHACNSKSCGQYFKVHVDDRKDKMCCPYCGLNFDKSELHTSQQTAHISKVATAEAVFIVRQELQKILRDAAGGTGGILSYKPSPIFKQQVDPPSQERKVDTQLTCPQCNCRFQIFGIFGYCPICRESNMQIYDTNWEIIKREVIAATENPERALRHAYSDLVSAFEQFCANKAKRFNVIVPSFQVLFDARKFFKEHAGIDMLDRLETSELIALRRVFQKRHVAIHNGGIISERYVKMIPEDKHLLGKKVTMTFTELESAAEAIKKALACLVMSIEKKG